MHAFPFTNARTCGPFSRPRRKRIAIETPVDGRCVARVCEQRGEARGATLRQRLRALALRYPEVKHGAKPACAHGLASRVDIHHLGFPSTPCIAGFAWTLLRHENNRSDAHPPWALSLLKHNCPYSGSHRRAARLCTDMERGALNGHV